MPIDLYHVRSINHNIPVGAGFLDGQLLAGIVCEPAPTKIGVALPDMILGIKRLKTRFLPRCLVAGPNILRETGFFFVSPIFKCQPRERLQHPFLKLYREGNQFAAESPSPEPFLIKLFLRQEVDSLEARE